jgi:hypothetical protein
VSEELTAGDTDAAAASAGAAVRKRAWPERAGMGAKVMHRPL